MPKNMIDNKTIQEKIKPFILDEESTWAKDAENYMKNWWWMDPRDYIHIKYLTLKRKIKNVIHNKTA
jgi:hypothetical protein